MDSNGNISKLFVPYHIAVIAKEKGFNEPCFKHYHIDRKLSDLVIMCNNDISNSYDYCTAPIYQQLVDWFREKHGIEIVIKPTISKHESSGSQKMFYSYELVSLETSKCFIGEVKETYYVALTEAMEQAFKPI